MTPKEVQDRFIDDFNMMGDSFGRYSYLVELAASMERMDPSEKNEENIVEGCQSRVWLSLKQEKGRIFIRADSDTLIIRGILFLLTEILSGRSAMEILSADLYFMKEAGITEALSPERRTGLAKVVETIMRYAEKSI